MKIETILLLCLISGIHAKSQSWKQRSSSDKTWHTAYFWGSDISPDSTEYWELIYINPSDTLEKATEQRYANGSLRGYQKYYNHGTKIQSGEMHLYFPAENNLDTGQIQHSHTIYNQQFDDTLESWWPNGVRRTLEIYEQGKRISGESFNEVGEAVAYIPYEQYPEFLGGAQQLMNYLGNNITYPKKLRRQRIWGMVIASFTVEVDGSISNTKIIQSPHELFSEEVLRVMNSMPAWKPGSQEGKPVRVMYNLPVQFSLP